MRNWIVEILLVAFVVIVTVAILELLEPAAEFSKPTGAFEVDRFTEER